MQAAIGLSQLGRITNWYEAQKRSAMIPHSNLRYFADDDGPIRFPTLNVISVVAPAPRRGLSCLVHSLVYIGRHRGCPMPRSMKL